MLAKVSPFIRNIILLNISIVIFILILLGGVRIPIYSSLAGEGSGPQQWLELRLSNPQLLTLQNELPTSSGQESSGADVRASGV